MNARFDFRMIDRSAALRQWFGSMLCAALLVLATTAPAQEVTLNLKNADIAALIGTVSEITGKNFIVDPRVKGKVTVISSRPMDAGEVYEVFQSVLKVHGFAVVPSGAVVKIVPDVNAKQDSIPTLERRGRVKGDQMVTRVIQVDNVAAAQLVPILRPLVPQQGHLAAYAPTNVLIISDRAANAERLVSIIRKMDQKSDTEIEVIPLEHASASEVVRIITALNRTPAAKGKNIAGHGGPVVIADERTNSVLLGGDRASRIRYRGIISHLDTPLDRGGNTEVVYLKYAQAADVVTVLQGVGEAQNKEKQAKDAKAKKEEFNIQADEATNALVITARPDIMRSIKAVIRQLDIRRAQVLVDAVIAEVSVDKARELGVQWLFDGSSDGSGPIGVFNFTNTGTSIASIASAVNSSSDGTGSSSLPAVGNGATAGFGKYRPGRNLNVVAVLNALAADANTNLLSTPTLVTLDNEEAEIVIGQNVPFVTGSFTSTGAADSATNPFQTIQRQDVGLTLKIKPQINEGDAIKLSIEQEVSSISPSTQASDIITDKRSIKTSVMVDDGQVVVLGGLIEDNVRESIQKVPLLGDIPVLGHLFRSNGTTKEKTNLMVFIHPVILKDAATVARFTGGKYDYMRALQIDPKRRKLDLFPGQISPAIPKLESLKNQESISQPQGRFDDTATPDATTGSGDSAPPSKFYSP